MSLLGGPSYVGGQPLCEPKEIEATTSVSVGKEQVTHNTWPTSKEKKKKWRRKACSLVEIVCEKNQLLSEEVRPNSERRREIEFST
jgi:hypothetical protein